MRHLKTTPTSAFIFYRSYSRWSQNARESWDDMVARCVLGLVGLGKLTSEEAELLWDEFENCTALPSGRYMWCGGTEWSGKQQNYPGQYNCFQGDTLVNTLEFGSVPIKELIGKQVNVVNKNREWVPVEFNKYGTQSLYEITMRRGVSSGAVKTIRATADHLWHLESGETSTTANLKSGFYIPFVTANRPVIKDESVYTLGIRHGIIYGDGSYRDSSSWGRVNFKVRLCSEKSELLQYFGDCNVCYPPSYNGDPVANVKGRDYIDYVPSINLKDLPETDNLDYLLGFFRGLLATDGSINSGGKSALCVNISGKLETLSWVETLAPRLGIENGTTRCLYEAGTESNFGVRKTSTYQALFYHGSITKDDLLRSKHKKKFGDGMKQPSLWRVLDVQDIDESETVYCCEEPITNTFVLTGGILTGNCSSTVVDNIATFGYLMDLAAMGCGTGAVLELENIAKLPPIKTKLNIELAGEIGTLAPEDRQENTLARFDGNTVDLHVGDSRRGWVESYVGLIQLAVSDVPGGELTIRVDLSSIRPAGEKLAGFGGTANPTKLPELYGKVAAILNGAIGRQMNSIECCKLIDEAAMVIVAGSIRRSAGIRQFSADDQLALTAKDNLWQQNEYGKWRIDPERDALRMANHTRVFHTKPTLTECIDSVRKQYYSGEGAIQWAGEAVARANADLLDTADKKAVFLGLHNGNRDLARDWLMKLGGEVGDITELDDRMMRYNLNPCAEIIGNNFMCNLAEVHLNTIDPFDLDAQVSAFKAASLSVAALLHHEFEVPRYQRSRELDPIVGVSFTGLFDFFVHLFGIDWLHWWQAGRPASSGLPININASSRLKPLLDADFIRVHHFDSMSDMFVAIEEEYLCSWKAIVFDTVTEYCERHGLKVPNRATTCQPAGSKSLLTGASPGWHPPKASRYIRRMTFGKGEPLALAAIDMGYSVIPSQSDKDEMGNLLTDIHDPRVTEWLVEIPCATSWADMPGVDEIEISQFSALAQFDFYMQVQRHYSTHTTSATIELREDEIEPLATAIYEDIQKDGGYMSAALLARFDSLETFPRLPFEPISKDVYDDALVAIAMRRTISNFDEALALHDRGQTAENGPSGCDSDKCLLALPLPNYYDFTEDSTDFIEDSSNAE